MTVVCRRSRATRPALALWLVVLLAETAAAGSVTAVGYLFAGVVAVAVALTVMWLMAGGHDRRQPQPVRVRARYDRRDRRR